MNNKLATAPQSESFDSYHERNCKICRHPDRPAIEYDFLHWRSPEYIAREYSFAWRSLYRHAHALDLFEKRRHNLRDSLEFLIEGASKVEASADGVIRAVELYTRINGSGERIEPPKTQVIVIARDGAPITIPNSAIAAKIEQNAPNMAQLASLNAHFLPQQASLPQNPNAIQPLNQIQTEFDVSR